MLKTVRLATPLTPVVVVVAFGELHAHLIGHYAFTGTGRFTWTVIYVLLLELAAYAFGIPDSSDSVVAAASNSFGAVAAAAITISLVQLATGSNLLPRVVVLGSALALVPLLTALCDLDRRARRNAEAIPRVLAILGPDEAAALQHDLTLSPEQPSQLVAVCPPSDSPSEPLSLTPATPGSEAVSLRLADLVTQTRANLIVLGRSAVADERIVAEAAELHGKGMRVRTISHFYEEWLGKLLVSDLERVSLMFDIQEIHAPRYARVKRLVDLTAGLVGSMAMLIVTPVVAVADLVGNRGPVFFSQERIGKGGRPFVILKYRTMTGTMTGEWTDVDDPRVSTLGRWMRRMHIDELPQSINLLRGSISLVGPRPEQPRYVDELRQKIPFFEVRHLVKPGVTGWAQVKYVYGSSVEDAMQKLQYEFFYMRHQGPLLDVRIMARTLRSLVRLDGR